MKKFIVFLCAFILCISSMITPVAASSLVNEKIDAKDIPDVPVFPYGDDNTGYLLYYDTVVSGGSISLIYYDTSVTELYGIDRRGSMQPGVASNSYPYIYFHRTGLTSNDDWIKQYMLYSDDNGNYYWSLASSVSFDGNEEQWANFSMSGKMSKNTEGWLYDSNFDIYYSSHDVKCYFTYAYAESNNYVFFPLSRFPLTLWETVELEIPVLLEIVFGAMNILTLCGVGCLALLILLNLFPKVLYKFL